MVPLQGKVAKRRGPEAASKTPTSSKRRRGATGEGEVIDVEEFDLERVRQEKIDGHAL